MPRDLFGDVTRPSISIGSKKWYSLPLSLVSHSAIVLALVAIPILAPAVMPSVFADNDMTITMIDLPKPPPAPRPIDTIKPVENPYAAPITAPDRIDPEPADPPDILDKPITGIVGGGDIREVELVPPPEPKKDPPPQAVRPGFQGVRTPVKTHHVDPVYPPFAIASRTQGIVIIEATISEDGRVINARVLRSIALLDPAALEAVRQWEFTPTTLNGKAVPVIMTVTVNFTLNR
jgi:protein TonB